ncbi:KR domain-containing protein [Microdochium bolleyi]|uniref:KR domain-containing protein n=1 Tax=Microdochium bolleyi TaxID=196109 RepID=A0A136IPI7_9PEZI|nr:KR domain-containing protein [Microdochium bolleyi]
MPPAAEPIAICGMALRLPGGINTPGQFWDFLINKRDAQGPIPETRYSASKYYSPAGKAGFVRSERGYFLDESVDLGALDTTIFTMPRNEVERADPQQRLLLELTRECLESAGEVEYRGKTIGSFVGSFGEDWASLFAKDTQVPALYKVSGYGDFVLSNRISYEFDLRGPSMTIRTGCSAALIGLHQACLAIRGGDCDSAIVGGSNLLMAPGLTADLSEQRVLSPQGSSKTFDADADGYARGEAINVIYVKRLSAAIRDGNPIRAVIRGTFANADGKKSGLTMPSYEAHEALIRRTYQIAGITDVNATGFVECHGTGTPVGDPIETRAIGSVFGERGVYIGSVKPNVGHSEGASGLTSLIKTVLALEHSVIPPNIKFNKPNPKIAFEEKKLTVPVEPLPWPKDRVERASVNSFGIGGANAHVIIDSARSFAAIPERGRPSGRTTAAGPHLVVFSANTEDSLRRQVANNQKFIDERCQLLPDISYTLGARRDHLPHRAFSVLAEGMASNTSTFVKAPSATTPRLVFVFTGQGAQWARMGLELLTSGSHPAFARSVRRMDHALYRLADGPSWSIAVELMKSEQESNMSDAAYSQPLCTAVQIALVDALKEYGVCPYAVVGHSSGELAAAYAAGKISSDEAIVAAYYRGIASGRARNTGAMAALGLSWEDAEPLLMDGVVVACDNSPSSVTISGDRAQVSRVLAAVKERDPSTFARELKVDRAYHSYHMQEVGELYESLLASHDRKDHASNLEGGQKPIMFSSVTGQKLLKYQETGAEYWRANLESPVLFRKAVDSLVEEHEATSATTGQPPLVFLEIGPHSALAGPLRQTLATRSMNAPYSSCLVRDKHAVETFLTAFGQLWQQNVSLNFSRLTNPRGMLEVVPDLPTYPWQHDHSLLYESRLFKRWRLPRARKHEILGARVIESTDNEPIWRNVLHLAAVPWLRDHQVKGDIVFPCAGYVGMVGEAVRQLTSLNDSDYSNAEFSGFSVRGMVIDTAMLLHEAKPTEVLTSLTRHRLTDTLDSDCWDFVISSHNGATWTRHCTGQICAADAPFDSDQESVKLFPRHVESPRWYNTMREVGGNYGPTFQGLADITCSTSGNKAAAIAKHTVQDPEEFYPVHPTKIDFFLQLLAVGAVQGVGHRMRTMAVPTYIEQMDVYVSDSELTMSVDATAGAHGAIFGSGMAHGCALPGERGNDCIDKKAVALRVRGVKISPLHGDLTDDNPDPHAAARTHWRQDIDFADLSSMVSPNSDQMAYTEDLRELTAICIRDSLHLLEDEVMATPETPHLRKFLDWMKSQAAPAKGSMIEPQLSMLLGTELGCMAAAVKQVLDHIVPIFRGEIEPIEVLMENNILSDVYKALNWSKRPEVFVALAHANPHMRILEIGAGTGGTTDIVLGSITSDPASQNQRMYASYTYTDVSAGFFGAAQERFKRHAGSMEFRVLDISQDPSEQGFEEHSYDLVIASNVLHATPTLAGTLRNVHRLLKPDGRLYLEELTTETKAWNYIMGILPGWWLGEADGRDQEPYVSPQRWHDELREAGFNGVDDHALDCPHGKHSNAFYLARPAIDWARPRAVTVLFDAESRLEAETLQRSLASSQYTVSIHDFADSNLPVDRDIISVLDLPRPFLDDIDSSAYQAFKNLMMTVSSSHAGIFWLTRPTQLRSSDPRWSQIQGVSRVLRSELALDLATCEVDTLDDDTCPVVERVFAKFMRRRSDDQEGMDPDYEYVIDQHGEVLIPRIYPFRLSGELESIEYTTPISSLDPSTSSSASSSSSVSSRAVRPSARLEIAKPGRLSSLRWVAHDVGDLSDDELLVEPKAVGMNFKDILGVMGVIDAVELGLEHAGIVLEVGKSEGDVQVGSRVMAMGGYGFSKIVKLSRNECVEIPDGLSFTDAATMATVFGTVIHGLLDIGRMRSGQTLLIHSACGGVGIAALQVARMIGVEVYCTVSSEAKRQYLETAFDIPRGHIFQSRDNSFHRDLMRATQGRGVDIVLNSLSGELLHASWDCVAEFGTMIEIGKRDLIGHGKLALNPFLLNRSYQCVDLAHLIERKPAEGHRLLKLTMQYYIEGHIGPIHPITVFAVDEVQDCFLHMQKGQHIGKIVVDMELKRKEHGHSIAAVVSAKPYSYCFDSSAAYLLVGGLGGLGRAVSSWMVSNGARHLIYLGRTAGDTAGDAAFFEELRSQACAVTAVKGDVTILADVERAVAAAGSTPLRGIINMSMVLRDDNFGSMSHEAWTAATGPKVRGTWNLHQATASPDHQLDFFLLFSSASATFGQRGQANYAAANTFLDAFVRYRHGMGLAAQSVNIGIMLDHGYVADNDAVRERLVARGGYGIRISELLDALSVVLAVPAGARTPLLSSSSASSTSALSSLQSSASSTYSATATSTSSINSSCTTPAQLILGARSSLSFHDSTNRVMFKSDRRMASYRNDEMGAGAGAGGSKSSQSSGKLSAFIAAATNNDDNGTVLSGPGAAEFLARQIGAQLLALLLRPVTPGEGDDDGTGAIEVTRSPQDLGLDSLVAIELRSWWKATFQCDISVLEMLATPTLLALGQRAVEGLKQRIAAEGLSGGEEKGQNQETSNAHGVDARIAVRMP